MQRNASSQSCRRNATHIAAIFWAESCDLSPRETKELAKYGAPADVPASAPVRAGYGDFNEFGFNLNEDGVRAFLFLIANEHGEPTDILAWAPLLNRLSSCLQTISVRKAERTGIGDVGICPCSNEKHVP